MNQSSTPVRRPRVMYEVDVVAPDGKEYVLFVERVRGLNRLNSWATPGYLQFAGEDERWAQYERSMPVRPTIRQPLGVGEVISIYGRGRKPFANRHNGEPFVGLTITDFSRIRPVHAAHYTR